MNAFYGDAPGLRVPEFIELFSNKGLQALTRHFLASPQQSAWLVGFQRDQMQADLTEAQKARYTDFLGPIIDGNFRQRPSTGPAFAQMTYQLTDEVAANTARLLGFRRSDAAHLGELQSLSARQRRRIHAVQRQERHPSHPRGQALAADRCGHRRRPPPAGEPLIDPAGNIVRKKMTMATANSPVFKLNNGIEMPALGLGGFNSPPETTVAAVSSAIANGYRPPAIGTDQRPHI
jgi:hypothetical protein